MKTASLGLLEVMVVLSVFFNWGSPPSQRSGLNTFSEGLFESGKEKREIAKMLLDEANDFSCATTDVLAFKMLYCTSFF